MLLDPFGRAEQALLFAVPCRIDDRPLRTPAALRKLCDGACFFHHRYLAARRIFCAVDPRITMIAADYPLIGSFASGHLRDDVVNRYCVPVEFELEMYGRSFAAEVIRHR